MSTDNRHQHSSPSDEGYEMSLDAAQYIKKTSVMVYLVTFLFIYASFTTDMAPGLYYLMLLLCLLVIGFWYETAGEEVFPREQLKIGAVPQQALGGVLCVAGYLGLVAAFGSLAVQDSTALGTDEFFTSFILMVVIVGMVETIMMIIYLRVMWLGVVMFPLLFAFSHTQIAGAWTQGVVTTESILFFLYAISQAIVFMALFIMRGVVSEPYHKYFGAITVAVYHGGVNAVNMIALVSLAGISLSVGGA